MKKNLTKNMIMHIWAFTMVFEILFDVFVDEKTNGYSYFWKGIDWTNLLVYFLLIPPFNVMFLNWYPFHVSLLKRFFYIVLWVLFALFYEVLALLPQPWGYFHYGWWNLFYSAILDPILFMILLIFYKWICKIETMN